jgi:hypothetical protein
MSAIDVFFDLVVTVMALQGVVMFINVALVIALIYYIRRLQPEELERILTDKGVIVKGREEEEND